MEIRPINSPADLAAALRQIESLWGAPLGTPDGDRLDVLATLVEAYESRDVAMADEFDPVDILNFAIEDMGRSQTELAQVLGSRSRASEILRRRRALTLDQIRLIGAAWKLPIALLAKPYRLARDAA